MAADYQSEELASLSDEDLVALVKAKGAHDDRPFATLYERHHRMVWSVCHRYLRDPQDAEDLMQEVFVRAYRGLQDFEGRSSLRTWLYRIAVNSCHNEFRRRRRRPALVERPLEELTAQLIEGGRTADPVPEAGRVLEAMATLAEADRQILILRELEGLRYDEIAQRLALGVSATKMRLHRARRALQRATLEMERDQRE